ncbi:hypothetical protein DD606_25640 [Enterobacter cloacae complex sp. GF14B]|nr:hypothetical protein DD606_25640 [Enterobacter cloacae complex sp. GF14B]
MLKSTTTHKSIQNQDGSQRIFLLDKDSTQVIQRFGYQSTTSQSQLHQTYMKISRAQQDLELNKVNKGDTKVI